MSNIGVWKKAGDCCALFFAVFALGTVLAGAAALAGSPDCLLIDCDPPPAEVRNCGAGTGCVALPRSCTRQQLAYCCTTGTGLVCRCYPASDNPPNGCTAA